MKYGAVVKFVAVVVVAVFAMGIWLIGDSLDVSWLRFYSAAVLIATLGLLAWEHWAWRSRLLQRIPKVKRSVRGTWRGRLSSQWVDSNTGGVLPTKTIYLVIRQTASTVNITMHTDESSSSSGVGEVIKVGGDWSLNYMYLNIPRLSVEHRSRIHHGSCSLALAGSPVVRMSGRYWTDRDSKGELEFDQRTSKLTDDYQSAAALFN